MIEKHTLYDFVDFSKVMLQKIDNVSVKENYLLLEYDGKTIKLPVKENPELVKKVIEERYRNEKLNLDERKIDMRELKELSIIDFERQKIIKDYIDDLVFALYFNIPLKKLGTNRAKNIKTICAKNSYYKLVSGNSVG